MNTLPEFLLARIAEDEEFALRYPPTAAARPRALAECDAKRRIVENRREAIRDVLELLALPYADHPDYDEAWRP